MPKFDVLFIGQDGGPSQDLKMAEAAAIGRGLKTHCILGEGSKEIIAGHPHHIRDAVKDSRLVVCAMDSSAKLAEGVFAAIKFATHFGVPVFFYGDNWDCVQRPWFESVRDIPVGFLVLDESEAEVGARLFPNATDNITITGCPRWELGKQVPIHRADARKELQVYPYEQVIFTALTKDTAVNMDLLTVLARTLPRITSYKVTGLVSLHPGDLTPRYEYLSKVPRNLARLLPEKTTKRYLPAADLLLNGTSSTGVEAAMQGIPVLEIKTPAIQTEEARIYPNGWRLPAAFPNLVDEASPRPASQAEAMLAHDLHWTGEVTGGSELIPQSAVDMADAIVAFLST